MSRPTGITIIAVLALVAAVPAAIYGLAAVGVATFVEAVPVADGFMYAVGAGTLIYAGMSLVLAYGFWTMKSWAWTVGVALQVLGIITAVSQFMDADRVLGSLITGTVFPLLIIFYLFRPSIRAAFGRA